MRKLLFIPTFILSLYFVVPAQDQQNVLCPSVEITTPSGANVGRDERQTVTANVNVDDWQSLKYLWKISPHIAVEEQGKPVVYFQVVSETDSLDLTATVEIKGLPENCQNVFSKSFRINFSFGTPQKIEDYEVMPFSKEKVKLDGIAARLKTLNNSNKKPTLYFINYLPKLDEKTKWLLTNRESKIRYYLTRKYKISKESIVFVRGEDKKYRTRVLVIPSQLN